MKNDLENVGEPHLQTCKTETIPGESFVVRPPYPVEGGECQCDLCKPKATGGECGCSPSVCCPQHAPVRPLTYLACPYSHPNPEVMEWRYEQATKAAAWLISQHELNVFSPITHSHPLHKLGGCKGDWNFWEKIDREYLGASNTLLILYLDGWEHSVGVNAELKIARELGLHIDFVVPLADGTYLITADPGKIPPMAIPFSDLLAECRATDLEDRTIKDTTNPKDLIGDTKPQLHLVPPTSLVFLAKVMELGAKKYGPYNWRSKKVRETVYISAALRHLTSALDGAGDDSESGQSHYAHAMACLAILLDAKATGNLIDDRPTPGCTEKLLKDLTVKRTV